MGLCDLLSREGVIHNLNARCKRDALQSLSRVAGELVDIPASDILRVVLEREQLGSTGVGDGVAIPHGKIEGLGQMTGILARLDHPINFDAMDDQPVDLVFLLLAPENATAAHLKALARVSRLLRHPGTRASLRGADTSDSIFAIATSEEKIDAA